MPHKALRELKANNVGISIQKPLKVCKGTLKLVKTNNMPREEWLAVRQQGIGSSDAVTVIGLNPYQSALELWMHKIGKVESLPSIDVNDDTHPVCWGNVLEPVVAKQYSFRTTGFNSIRTLMTRLRYFAAVSGNNLAAMPLELKLRGKTTT